MFAAGPAQPLLATPPDSRISCHRAADSSSIPVQPRGRRAGTVRCSASSGQPAPRRKAPSSSTVPAPGASAWASALSVSAPGPLFTETEEEPEILSAGAPAQEAPAKARASPPGASRLDAPPVLFSGSAAVTPGAARDALLSPSLGCCRPPLGLTPPPGVCLPPGGPAPEDKRRPGAVLGARQGVRGEAVRGLLGAPLPWSAPPPHTCCPF